MVEIRYFFSKKKYSKIKIIDEGGWHFTNIKSAEEIHHKMKNFLHHFEYENSGLKIEDVKNLIKEKKALYNNEVDQRQKKWLNNPKLVKIDLRFLPNYIIENKNKYEKWLE